MPPHPSQLTVVDQPSSSQAPPLLPQVITVPAPVPTDTSQIFVVIQEMRTDMQEMWADMQTQQLTLQDHAQHQQQMTSTLLTLTSNLNGFGFSK